MPTVNGPVASQGPAKATSKYSNKDGTKYISVPKSTAATPAAQPSPTTTSTSSKGVDSSSQAATLDETTAPAVNRKKQKRRAKAAAKAAAEQAEFATNAPVLAGAAINGSSYPGASRSRMLASGARHHANSSHANRSRSPPAGEHWGDETESEDGSHLYDGHIGQESHANGGDVKSKKSRKKKKNKNPDEQRDLSPPPAPSGISREKIWNTSGPEERERIKQFWLGLGEDERKSLVKVEKDAVLKKMKEQQKHTCSCSVCGRKRTAIEEELEGLYDAYYEELESFANQPHNHPNGPSMFGGPKRFGPMTGLHPPGALPTRYSNHHPSRGRIVEHVDNEEDEDEEDDEDDVYSEEEEDELDDEDDEDEPEEISRNSYQNEFFTFGQSLTVKGGILTVADDLLKNDGKKFIEMMEQLAERRMAREEDAKDHYASYGHGVNGGNLPPPHNHPPPDEEEYDEDDEEQDDDFASQEYDDEDEEEDAMTEEQRMEEGRRMFQIFAARMFEQRVLTAYREKVAKERQEKLLEELAAEDLRESQKVAKKAKDAQKRKDKAAQKKQAQLEEKARKEAAKAAEDAARQAEEAERIEEAKRRAEDKRRKKEAQKKAEEDDRLRKEAERQRRAIEQKEKQAEQERKAREAKEREKQVKEERQRKEQEAREQKERETRERREKHERDKREKEQRAAHAKAERDAKEKQKQEDKASLKSSVPTAPASVAHAAKRHATISVPALPHHPSAGVISPQISVATPVLPKAPTPAKPRTASQEVLRSGSQTSQAGSGLSMSMSPQPPPSVLSTPGQIGSSGRTPPSGSGVGAQPPQQRTMTPLGMKSPPGLPQSPYNMGMPPAGMQFPPGIPPLGLGFGQAIFPPMPGSFRPGALPPPGLGGQLGGRPFPMTQAPPGFHQLDPLPIHPGFGPIDGLGQVQPGPHSRQASLSFESGLHDNNIITTPVQPIARPAPIGRPSISNAPRRSDTDIDDMNNHLGSSALLDDDVDEPFQPGSAKRGTAIPGTRQPFAGGPFMDSVFGTSPMNNGWVGPLHNAFAPPPGFGNPAWPPSGPAFGAPPPGIRLAQPRSITIRQILAQSCKDLQNHAADAQGWIDLSAIKGHVDSIAAEPVTEAELLDMCETEGNMQNGGGTFDVKHGDNGKASIKYDPDMAPGPSPFARNIGAPGEIGSPIVGHAATFGSRF